MGTQGRFIGVWDNFHLNFPCKWLCLFTRSETAVTKILFNGVMSATNATNIAKEILRGHHFEELNSLNFILCSWCHLARIDEKTQCVHGKEERKGGTSAVGSPPLITT